MDVSSGDFIWDLTKELANFYKHGVDFASAARVFQDSDRGDKIRILCAG